MDPSLMATPPSKTSQHHGMADKKPIRFQPFETNMVGCRRRLFPNENDINASQSSQSTAIRSLRFWNVVHNPLKMILYWVLLFILMYGNDWTALYQLSKIICIGRRICGENGKLPKIRLGGMEWTILIIKGKGEEDRQLWIN